MYKVTEKSQDILQNTTIRPDGKSGAWLAINTGTTQSVINGIPLAPGEGIQYTFLRPDVIWNSEIKITMDNGGRVRLIQLQYSEA